LLEALTASERWLNIATVVDMENPGENFSNSLIIGQAGC